MKLKQIKDKYLGKHILVGLTYLENDDSFIERKQFHGTIKSISKNTITFIRSDNGEDYSIPYDEGNLEPGQPEAVYELKSTGEAIENVDFISCWTIYPPKKNRNNL